MERISTRRLVLAGTMLWSWLLCYPYYGPLGLALLGPAMPAAGHAFSLGHALGFALSVYLPGAKGATSANERRWIPALLSRPGFLLAATSGLSALVGAAVASRAGANNAAANRAAADGVSISSAGAVTVLLFLAGMTCAPLVLGWVTELARHGRPAVPLAVAMLTGNLVCWGVSLPPPLRHPYVPLVLLTLAVAGTPLLLSPSSRTSGSPHPASLPLLATPAESSALPPPSPPLHVSVREALSPYLLFGLAVFPCCGLMFRVVSPILSTAHLGWVSYWPYIISVAPAAWYVVRRGHVVLAPIVLSLLGLSLLAVAFSPTPGWLLAAYSALLCALAGADMLYWVGLINLFRAGVRSAPALGLAFNIIIVVLTGMAADFFRLADLPHVPLAAAPMAGLLFLLIPFLLPRLIPEPSAHDAPPVTLSIEGSFPKVSVPATISGAQAGVRADTFAHAPAAASLSPAEARVAALLLQGYKYGDIAARLVISPNTVKYHVHNILQKTGCATRGELAARFLDFKI